MLLAEGNRLRCVVGDRVGRQREAAEQLLPQDGLVGQSQCGRPGANDMAGRLDVANGLDRDELMVEREHVAG